MPAPRAPARRRLLGLINRGSYLLFLMPFALGLLYVRLYGVNVPYNNGWTLVPLFEKLSLLSILVVTDHGRACRRADWPIDFRIGSERYGACTFEERA